jgi:hypothetical protein
MGYALYVAVKLISYVAWCWFGLRLWRTGSASLIKSAGFGILRLGIGVAFGLVIFFLVQAQPEDVLWKYVAIYLPVRMVEWLIMALIIGRKSGRQSAFNSIAWCLGGILVSFVADFASPEGVAGHFCIGRCLC